MTDSQKIEISQRWWSPRQVAESLNVEERTIRRWCASGIMPHSRMGRLIRIGDSDLSQFLATVRSQAQKKLAGQPAPIGDRLAELSRDESDVEA